MDLTPKVTRYEQTPPGPRRVRVPDREDVGLVMVPGHNFGTSGVVRVLGIYFPDTGECTYYEVATVRDAES